MEEPSCRDSEKQPGIRLKYLHYTGRPIPLLQGILSSGEEKASFEQKEKEEKRFKLNQLADSFL